MKTKHYNQKYLKKYRFLTAVLVNDEKDTFSWWDYREDGVQLVQDMLRYFKIVY